jgi:hypothetical protein
MITANIAACIKGLRLICDGKAEDAYELMKECTPRDFLEAADILEDQSLWAGKLMEIAERHQGQDHESVRDLVVGAAAAGDEEAQALLDCGFLETKAY